MAKLVYEYIVTLHNANDLESFYEEMAAPADGIPTHIPDREVECAALRPLSRNTHYMMTEEEADQLRKDPRVKIIELAPVERGISAGTFLEQSSLSWNKSSTTNSLHKNWGLLRCVREDNIPNWGSDSTTTVSGTITLTSTGKNVDVVICDENGLVWNHPEYAVNADGTGGTRAVQYNWYQHNPEVTGGAPGTYTYGTGSHSTHVAGTAAGNTQGWARDANIYNLYYDTGNSGNFSLVFDYVRAFHRNKPINPATGRKNPTIVNNSWGQSIFPGEWSFNDITAVTYRGTRYTPAGSPTIVYTGFSGVCSSSTKLGNILNLENGGNRIVTTSTVNNLILSKPSTWAIDSLNNQAYLASFDRPDQVYQVTVQGPCTVDIISQFSGGSLGGDGITTLANAVDIIYNQAMVLQFSDGPRADTDSPTDDVSVDITQNNISLPNTGVYTIVFTNSIVETGDVGDPIYATAMSVRARSTSSSVTTSSIPSNLLGPASLTASTTPTNIADNTTNPNDDAYWLLTLPFNISYLGVTYNQIYVSTNHYLTFGGGSFVYSGISESVPALPKISASAADNSIQRIYYGVEGTAPNRTYRVRTEGNAATSGTLGSPNMVHEWTFYENDPGKIDLQTGVNNRKTSSGGGTFTTAELNGWGFVSGQRIPARVTACDEDIIDAMEEGIIFVGAAGNGRWKHDVPGGADWDNTFEMSNRYPGQIFYYMRGTSPTANDLGMPNICVGATDVLALDKKSYYSDCGPGVDLYSPGTQIISALPSGTADPRSASYYLGKYNGTSMASPQVCGVIACALETYPNMNQAAAKAYILSTAKSGKLTTTSGGPTDITDLQGSANLHLYYKKERPTTGTAFPKQAIGVRPATGATYPRPRLRRRG